MEIEATLKNHLKKHSVNYIVHEHPAAFTVSQSDKMNLNLPCLHTKNLFLKGASGNFYLVCIEAHKMLNLSELKTILLEKKLEFGSALELRDLLHLTPGSVSILGLIFSNSVELILDKSVWEAKSVGVHPNINAATLELSHSDLEKFYCSLSNKKRILAL
jgi:Ala-tRNA(Pro) deacylase